MRLLGPILGTLAATPIYAWGIAAHGDPPAFTGPWWAWVALFAAIYLCVMACGPTLHTAISSRLVRSRLVRSCLGEWSRRRRG